VAGSQQEAGAEAEAVQQRRSRIAEAALERDSFELAFRLIGDYRLAAEPIYTAAARRLARAQAKPALLRLLREVGATITDAERDEVVSQALEVWVREHGDVRAARALVAFIAAPAAKVAALLLVTLSLSLTHSLTHSLSLTHPPVFRCSVGTRARRRMWRRGATGRPRRRRPCSTRCEGCRRPRTCTTPARCARRSSRPTWPSSVPANSVAGPLRQRHRMYRDLQPCCKACVVARVAGVRRENAEGFP
jgi:hypothetical protein